MQQLPAATVDAARELLAAGWTASDQAGRVDAPPGLQPTTAHWVSDWCWQAMCLLSLERANDAR